MKYRPFLLLLLLFFPVIAQAGGAFDVPPTDKSMQYLGNIFGSIGSLPIQGGTEEGTSTIFRTLVDKFNVVIFVLGIIIIAWTTLMGTVSTAQEGEILGKKMSSIWVPARVGLGMYFLLPHGGAGGYSLIQTGVMWMVVQGVGAANAIFEEIISNPASIHEDTRKVKATNPSSTLSGIFEGAVCAAYINEKPEILGQLDDAGAYIDASFDGNRHVFFGYPGTPETVKFCGGITLPDPAELVDDDTLVLDGLSASERLAVKRAAGSERQAELADAVVSSFQVMYQAAYESVVFVNDPDTWAYTDTLARAWEPIQNALTSLTATKQTITDDKIQKAVLQGWIHAGSYYVNIIGGYSGARGVEHNITMGQEAIDSDWFNEQFSSLPSPATHYGKVLESKNPYWEELKNVYRRQAQEYNEAIEDTIRADDSKVNFGFKTSHPSVSGSSGGAFNAVFGGLFMRLTQSIAENITSSDSDDPAKKDPILNMANFGTDVVVIVEIVFFTGIIVAFFIWLGAGIMCSMQPLCNAMNFVLGIIMSIAGMLISLLWVGAMGLALYVPLIPYLVFTFSAITWIILVIEALLAAPLVGLTLVMPSDDELGKAGNGIVILLGLFLRPPLMILGFLFSIKLIFVAMTMLNVAFFQTIEKSVRMDIGIFGPIAVFTAYVGICIAIVHECFTLIYKVPDQVLRWIGSSSAGGDEMSKVKGLKGAADKGAAAGAGAMKGALKFAGDKAGSKMGGGGGGGGSTGLGI